MFLYRISQKQSCKPAYVTEDKVIFNFRKYQIVFIDNDSRLFCSISKREHAVHMYEVLDFDCCHGDVDYERKVASGKQEVNQYW